MARPSVPELVVDSQVLVYMDRPDPGVDLDPADMPARIAVLEKISGGRARALFSEDLIKEYEKQIAKPMTDFVLVLLTLLGAGDGRAEPNWNPMTGSLRQALHDARFPKEDYHLVQTALKPHRTSVVTEEPRCLVCERKIKRNLDIAIVRPAEF